MDNGSKVRTLTKITSGQLPTLGEGMGLHYVDVPYACFLVLFTRFDEMYGTSPYEMVLFYMHNVGLNYYMMKDLLA